MAERIKVQTGTIVRTVLLVLALLNQLLMIAGHSPIPIEDETVMEFISTGATIVITAITWWKNNSFTQAALQGDRTMRAFRG